MHKHKICFVAPFAWPLFAEQLGYSPKNPFGGMEVQLHQLAQKLAKGKVFKVFFLVGDFGQKSPLIYKDIKIYKMFKPALLNELPSGGTRYYIKTIEQSLKLWKALTYAQADIYLQSAAGGETGIIAFFCKLFRKKFAYLVASDIDVSGEYIKRNGLRGKIFSWGLKNADLVIAQHLAQKKLLTKNPKKNISIMRFPVSLIRNITPVKKNFVLYVGRADPCKKPKLFLELASHFPQTRFVMICRPLVYYKKLFQQIKESVRQRPNLEFIEHVTQIDQYFNEAQVLVNTSDYEGFPNTFVQAAKNKTPLLSFKVNPDNFINQYQCGFCAKGNFDTLVKKLKELLGNETLRTQMGNNAFSYARQHHDINTVIPKFKELLRSLVTP